MNELTWLASAAVVQAANFVQGVALSSIASAAAGISLHPFAFALAAVSLAAALGLLLAALCRMGAFRLGRGAEPRLRALYEESRSPALLSSAAGRIRWVNRAARQAGLNDGESLAAQISRIADIDDAGLYRLSRRALDLGFALAPAEEAGTRQRRYIAVQSGDQDTLLWTVQSADHEALKSLVQHDAGFETAGFGHIGVAPDGRIAANARFRELFGDRAKAILDRLPPDRAPEGGRVLLPLADGRLALTRVFMIAEPGDERRDYLFFPTDDDSGLLTGPSAALEAVPLALLRLDIEGRILWTNSAARQLLGPGFSIGQSFSTLVEPIGRPVSAMIQTALRGLQRGRADMVRLARDDIDAFLQVSLTRARLDENESLIAVLTDASEIRQLEDQFAQSQKMEAVGKLAGGVAHDFNNVLTAISGHTDLLLLGKDISHPDYSDLMQVRQNSNRAAALVRQLLAFSRKQTLAPEDLSLRDVIADTLYLLDRLIGENVSLKLDQERELWSVRADQQQLEQALMNLVVNARDAMPDGGTVTISTRNRSVATESHVDQIRLLPGEYVEITVEDEGAGIPEHLLDRVFEPFFTTKPLGEGTGLGLSTVYGIVKQSGGSITAGNRPDGGARFRVFLPRVRPDESVDASRTAIEAPPDRADMTGKGMVLLVEDEAPVRSFARRALQLRGYEVEAVESAEVAMDYLSSPSNPVDLIVSDVVMPGMDGPTFAAEARKLRPGLPVIFVSGYAEDSFRKNLVDHDFLFLPKPFSLTELTAKVKEALS